MRIIYGWGTPVAEIARRLGLSETTVRKWIRAVETAQPVASTEEFAGAEPQAGTALDKLRAAFDAQLENFAQNTSAAEMSAADRERQARTLSSLARTLEKCEDLTRQIAQGTEQTAGADEEDRDALRAELQRRLARLADTG